MQFCFAKTLLEMIAELVKRDPDRTFVGKFWCNSKAILSAKLHRGCDSAATKLYPGYRVLQPNHTLGMVWQRRHGWTVTIAYVSMGIRGAKH